MRTMRTFTSFAAILAAVLFVSAAHANTITLSLQQPVTAGAGGFTEFTYNASLTGDSALVAGDYFVIYDFNGFAGFDNTVGAPTFAFMGSTGVWTAAVTPTGPYPVSPGSIPAVSTPGVDSSLLNLVFTYTGPTVFSPIGNLVTVSALSGVSTTVSGQYGSQDHVNDGTTALGVVGVPQGIIQGVKVPGAGGPGNFVPVPAAVWGGLSLFGLLGGKRFLRARREIA